MTDISDRIISEANYLIENRSTVRETGKFFGVSKSTVHKDLTERLYHEARRLYNSVRAILDENKAVRHLRGGQATREKYLGKKAIAEGSKPGKREAAAFD